MPMSYVLAMFSVKTVYVTVYVRVRDSVRYPRAGVLTLRLKREIVTTLAGSGSPQS